MKTFEGELSNSYEDSSEDGMYWTGYDVDYTPLTDLFAEFEGRKIRVTIEEIA